MSTAQRFEDLPRLTDPIADVAAASVDTPDAQRLLTDLQAGVARVDSSGASERSHPNSGSRGVRRVLALAVTIAVLAGLLTFALPFGSGTPPADALQRATDLLRASSSGRATSVETRVLNGQTATATTQWEWNGNNSHGRTDFVGSYSEELHEYFTVFTPASFETYEVDATVLMALDDGPFRPATSFGPGPQAGALERFERLIAAVDDLGDCGGDAALASPVEGTDVSSYCGSGSGPDFYRQVTSDSVTEYLDAGDIAVRVDVDNTTGIVAALSVEVVNLVERPWTPPGSGFDDLEIEYTSLIEQVTWHDLGEDIEITLPAAN